MDEELVKRLVAEAHDRLVEAFALVDEGQCAKARFALNVTVARDKRGVLVCDYAIDAGGLAKADPTPAVRQVSQERCEGEILAVLEACGRAMTPAEMTAELGLPSGTVRARGY